MNRTSDHSDGLRPCLRLLGSVALPLLLVLGFLSAAGAQEPTQQSTPVATIASRIGTPTAIVEPTPDQNVKTLVHIEVDAQTKPLPSGTEFEARVMVDSVEHLAGFSFTISYDPKRLQPVKPGSAEITPENTPVAGLNVKPVKARAIGDIFASSPRSDVVTCGPVEQQGSTVTAFCVTRSAPVCLGGLTGAAGSGLLGAVYFKSKGGGPTTLTLAASDLALDSYKECTAEVVGTKDNLPDACLPFRQDPSAGALELSCEPDGTAVHIIEGPLDVEGQTWVRLENKGWATTDFLQANGSAASIPNRRQNATIDLAKDGGGSSTLLVVIIGVVVVVIIGGGTGGYLWNRRRQAGPSA